MSDALESIWIPDDQLFDAAVSVCAPVLRKPSAAESAADSQLIPTWTELAAEAMGVPSVHLRGEQLSTIADCTAGFRHEFYEVANATIEQDSRTESANFPRLITVGLIDPARLLWGERAARIAGTTFTHPVVDVSKLVKEFALRKRPKILVATQTRIIEAVADYDGSLWPSVPVISALPLRDGEEAMDLLLAAVLAPPASVWAARQAAGTARSPGAVRLSATQLELLPLPTNSEQWRAGAAQLRAGELEAAAVTLTDAYGLDQSEQTAVLNWWALQSKRRKRQGETTGL